MGKPFQLAAPSATVLAQICCHKNQLPQGAPTSPIMSNFICAKLDSELSRFAYSNKCRYTRYADDISFSCRLSGFPKKIAKRSAGEDGQGAVNLSPKLVGIIESNGFQINTGKVRLQSGPHRREVTGLIVNKKVNVPRTFVRNIRAMLHAWEKFGLEAAENEYREKHHRKHRHPERDHPSFPLVLKGKIDFLKMVKGADDPVYRYIRYRFDMLAKSPWPIIPRAQPAALTTGLWILESCVDIGKTEPEIRLGTAFALKDIGIVTNFHVLGGDTEAFQADDPLTKYEVYCTFSDKGRDIAILKIRDAAHHAFFEPTQQVTQHRDTVFMAGFPHYHRGDPPRIVETQIASFRSRCGIDYGLLADAIIEGNSGGPVLDCNCRVVGIASRGASGSESGSETEMHGFIPIQALYRMIGPKKD